MELERIIEAILFSSSRPLPLKTLVKKLDDYSIDDVQVALRALMGEYHDHGKAVEIIEVAGGYQLRTKPEYRDWVKRFAREKDAGLTRSMLEALAVVAYKQPVSKSDIDRMRGVDSARTVRQLLEERLIEIGSREDELGQRITFRTTKRFLELYGLRQIGDLPTYRELESLER